MGKYMRKRAGRAPAAEVAQVVVGVSTRSRSAAAAAPAPKRPRKDAGARAEVEVEAGCAAAAAAAGCYLQLRSRRLFMAAAAEARCPVPAEEKAVLPSAARSGGASGDAPVAVVVAGISRCSSTASSVDIVVAAARERSVGEAEARVRHEESDVGSAVSDSSAGCGRERREATPSSRPPVDLRDEDPNQAPDDHDHRHRCSSANVTTAVACRARTPPEAEIEAFFAAAEKAEAERFAAKYNFDFARGVPLDAAGGRFEWTTVASSG